MSVIGENSRQRTLESLIECVLSRGYGRIPDALLLCCLPCCLENRPSLPSPVVRVSGLGALARNDGDDVYGDADDVPTAEPGKISGLSASSRTFFSAATRLFTGRTTARSWPPCERLSTSSPLPSGTRSRTKRNRSSRRCSCKTPRNDRPRRRYVHTAFAKGVECR